MHDTPKLHGTGRDIYEATIPFTEENRATSWLLVLSTFAIMTGLCAVAGYLEWWPARVCASLLAGLMMVRGFILYHDYQHGAILQHSFLAKLLMNLYGSLALTPPSSWRKSHNYHHAHVGKIEETGVGSFLLMTTDQWREAGFWQRVLYRANHSVIVLTLSYFTVFLFNVCVGALVRNPRKHWDSAVSLILHFGLIATLWYFFGFAVAFFAFFLPMFIASALGGYLFYAQHNYEDMQVMESDEWDYFEAALRSSSFMKLGPIMQYFTGNIGFHDIHHLNHKIPFYRLPEATKALSKWVEPAVVTLSMKDVYNCFRLVLWDPVSQRMVSYRMAENLNRARANAPRQAITPADVDKAASESVAEMIARAAAKKA